jgi:competence protein ComFC
MPGTNGSTKSDFQEARAVPGLLASQSLMRRWLRAGIQLVFPPRCAGCGRVDEFWCARCQVEIDAIPLATHVEPCSPLVAVAFTGTHTGKLQEAQWALKYDNMPEIAEPLGQRLAERFLMLNWTIDMIVPVPMHAARLRERGYNQAQLLGEYAARQLTIPCIAEAIRRLRQTQSQVTLNAQERLANMQDAFEANPQLVTDQTILLIDDVYTTGATLAACAQAALDAGATAVYGLTVTSPRG